MRVASVYFSGLKTALIKDSLNHKVHFQSAGHTEIKERILKKKKYLEEIALACVETEGEREKKKHLRTSFVPAGNLWECFPCLKWTDKVMNSGDNSSKWRPSVNIGILST